MAFLIWFFSIKSFSLSVFLFLCLQPNFVVLFKALLKTCSFNKFILPVDGFVFLHIISNVDSNSDKNSC